MGINPNRKAHWFLGLDPSEITLAEQFKKQAYKTFMVGKWHLGTEPEFHPLVQGFDSYYGMPCNFAHSPMISHEKDWGMVAPAMAKTIADERQRRHPIRKQTRTRRKKEK